MSPNKSYAPVASAGFGLRMMRVADIPGVAAIERAAFSESWPQTAFERELSVNSAARYITLVKTLEGSEAEGEGEAVGFAGLWLMLDEAHVVSVAVAPALQGNGFGRLLLHGLIGVARKHQMSVATLECRESNVVARSLYRAYGFYEVGRRKRYYADNHEDAIIMTTEELESAPFLERFSLLESALATRLPGTCPYAVDA